MIPAMRCSCTEFSFDHSGQCPHLTRDGCDMCERPICGTCNSGEVITPCIHGNTYCDERLDDGTPCDRTIDSRRIVRCHPCVKKYGHLTVYTVDTLADYEAEQEYQQFARARA